MNQAWLELVYKIWTSFKSEAGSFQAQRQPLFKTHDCICDNTLERCIITQECLCCDVIFRSVAWFVGITFR